MISIKVANEEVDLPPDISINFNLLNPMFNDVGDHSLSFELPKTDKNNRLFGFPSRVEKTEIHVTESDCSINYGG